MNYYFVKNQRNGKNLIYDKYIYNFDKTQDGCTKWRCLNRKCKGILIFKSNGDIKVENHNHEQEIAKIEKLRIRNILKRRAIDSRETPKQIITEITKIETDDAIKMMINYKSLTDRITKERNKKFNGFKAEFNDIPEVLRFNMRNERFLFFDSGILDPDRIIIYCSDFGFDQLAQATAWLIDGTFKSVPHSFFQLVTIHGIILENSMPLVYILLLNKQELTYERTFLLIKTKLNVQPKSIIIDFEKALINAVTKVFTKSNITSCIFHFGQACWRKLRKVLKYSEYKNNKIIRMLFRNLLSLCFVPKEKVEHEFEKIMKNEERKVVHDIMNDFINYFIRNYIGQTVEEKKIPPIYPVEFWSVYYNIINGLPRSTCAIEAWHRSLNSICVYPHPNFAKLIEVFQKEEEAVRIKCLQGKNGKFRVSEKNYLKEEKLRTILYNYNYFENLGFFNAIFDTYEWKFD